MKSLSILIYVFIISLGCQSIQDNALPNTDPMLESRSVCDYDIIESTLTNTGWTKRFDESFSGNLTQWNIWTGGAYNNELQYYQSPNLVVQNGVLTIMQSDRPLPVLLYLLILRLKRLNSPQAG